MLVASLSGTRSDCYFGESVLSAGKRIQREKKRITGVD
jgi:hypothetical protein